ncbi:MAG: alpha/beta hydrolase [Pseudomonadota bacterium]
MIVRFVFALLLGACLPAVGADANRFAFTLAPAERFEVGTTLVERHGQQGTPLILIPDLASGPWAWQETVRQMMTEHPVYVLTLPGFDGRPAQPGQGIGAAQDALRELIVSRKLAQPVLVGHGLGGMIALALAAQHPQLVGGVVSLDGLPLTAGSEEWTPQQRLDMAGRMKASTQAAFEKKQQQSMRETGVIDMARADELAKLSARSDASAVAKYMADAMATDLRPVLASIKAPVLLITPYFEPDAAQLQVTQQAVSEDVASLMKGTPQLKVVMVAPARHFAMIDQPQMVIDAIREFLRR